MPWASISAAWCSLLQNTLFLSSARVHFFHDADPEALRMRAWCKFHFFSFRFYFFSKVRLTTVTHFGPPDPPPGGVFISESLFLLREFDVFSENHQNYLRNLILFGLGWPLGRHVGLGPPPWDLSWLSLVASLVLDAFWGPLWMHLGSFLASFQVFRHPTASYFLNFNHIFDFTYRGILKSRLLYIIFLFYVAVCEETWSAELPEGSIFMI